MSKTKKHNKRLTVLIVIAAVLIFGGSAFAMTGGADAVRDYFSGNRGDKKTVETATASDAATLTDAASTDTKTASATEQVVAKENVTTTEGVTEASTEAVTTESGAGKTNKKDTTESVKADTKPSSSNSGGNSKPSGSGSNNSGNSSKPSTTQAPVTTQAPSSNNNSGNSNSTSKPSTPKPSTPATTQAPETTQAPSTTQAPATTEAVCLHDWQPQYVHHDAEYKTETYKTREQVGSYYKCNGCGLNLSEAYGSPHSDAATVHLGQCHASFSGPWPIYQEVEKTVTYLYKNEYDELTGYKCSKCGATKGK